MAHHKRRRPKHQRAGCLMCKPHKDERVKKVAPVGDRRKVQADDIDNDVARGFGAHLTNAD